MALPSQGGRVGLGPRAGGGRGGRRKGGPGVVPIVFVVLLVGGGIGAWQLLTREPGEADASTGGDGGGGSEFENRPLANAQDDADGPRNTPTQARAPRTEPARPSVTIVTPSESVPTSTGPTSTGTASTGPSGTTAETRTDPIASTPPAAAPTRIERPASTTSSARVASLLRQAEEARLANDLVRARALLTAVIASPGASRDDVEIAREDARLINDQLVFSPLVAGQDPISYEYRVKSGDTLSRIASYEGLAVDWRFIQRVNRVQDPSKLRLGQRLKLVRGPFHAVVDKSDYRLDLYQGPPDEPDEWTFIRSFPVGLGEFDATPVGMFVVREDSKLINPRWINPRTGEVFENDDPLNPIGERWVGLRGLGEAAVATGYGIHGTIEPDSIGSQESMGCVRMLPDDVAVMYELLVESASVVEIRE